MSDELKANYEAPEVTDVNIVARELLSTGGPAPQSLGIDELGEPVEEKL
jgi:hypothetical protein